MAKSRKNSTRGASYTRSYELLGGDIAQLNNMYIDYESGGDGIETLVGYRSVLSLDGRINGLYKTVLDGEECLIIHAKDKLYRQRIGEEEAEEIGTLIDTPTAAFNLGESLYILDGEKITELSSDGRVSGISDAPYIPTTYKNGSPYEERNLLTVWSEEVYEVATAEEFTYGSSHLLYSITSNASRECAVSGVDKKKTEPLFVPSYKYIGGVRYAVTEILPHALEGSLATGLTVAEGVEKIGDNAVRSCQNLARVILPTSVQEIGSYAFASSPSLEYLRVGLGLTRVGNAPLANCPADMTVAYEGDSAQLSAVSGSEALTLKTVAYNAAYTTVTVAFSTHGYGFKPASVFIDESPTDFTEVDGEVRVELNYKSELEGKTVRIRGFELEELGRVTPLGRDLVSLYGHKTSPMAAVLGCRLARVHDGRVFLSANPALPGLILYSSKTADGECRPDYFGSYSFLATDSSHAVSSLSSYGSTLIVTKEGNLGDGAVIYYESARETTSPHTTRYERVRTFSLPHGVSHATVYSGKPLFISGGEILGEGYLKGDTGDRIRISDKAPGGKIISLEWRGYLFFSIGERVFLLDKRGEGGYKIYPLSDVGGYENSTRVCVYADIAPAGLKVSEKRGEVSYRSVISEMRESGEMIYYVIENGEMIAVTPTEELSCGIFHPLLSAVSIGARLYFGTEHGEVYLFNNDMRGVPPKRLKESPDFDEELYAATFGDKIHPDFYDFAGHRIKFSLTTREDDCDEPTSQKHTSEEGAQICISATVACTASYTSLRDGVGEEKPLPTGAPDFSSVDFSTLTFDECDRHILREDFTPWKRRATKVREGGFRAPVKLTGLCVGYRVGRKMRI